MAEQLLSIRREPYLIYSVGHLERTQGQAYLQWSVMVLSIADTQLCDTYFCGRKSLEKILNAITAP
jgi:hypothetical protein